MPFNYCKLKGKIVEKYSTQYAFAREMGWSERTLSLKLNGIRSWKQPEICKAIISLGLKMEDIVEYFFQSKVQNS